MTSTKTKESISVYDLRRVVDTILNIEEGISQSPFYLRSGSAVLANEGGYEVGTLSISNDGEDWNFTPEYKEFVGV